MKLKNLFLYSLIFLFVASCGRQEEKLIKIGAVLCLTGSGSVYGQDSKRGLELGQELINNSGGISGRKIQLLFQDDKTVPSIAFSAASYLINTEKVPVIIGAVTSSSTLAITSLANQNKTILFSPGASSPKITSAGDYVFRNWISDTYEGKRIAEYTFNVLNKREVFILYINNDYGEGLKDVFEKRFVELGGKILGVDGYLQGSTNFRANLTKIKKLKPQGIYLPGYYQEIALILNQSKELGVKSQFLSCVSFEDPELLKIAKTNAENVIYATPYFNTNDSNLIVKEFTKLFKRKFEREPGTFAAHSFDAFQIIIKALMSAGSDTEKIKSFLYKLNNYQGVTGITSFDKNGDVEKPVSIKMVKDGRFIFLN